MAHQLRNTEICHCKRGRWKGQGVARWRIICLSLIAQLKTFFSLLIFAEFVAFWYSDFYTTLYFVNQRNHKPLALQAHTLTCRCFFCSLNVIISHKEGLGYLSICAVAFLSSLSSHMCICNGQWSLELLFVCWKSEDYLDLRVMYIQCSVSLICNISVLEMTYFCM
jgi:glucose-6-phosphate-specific signal transduction histidine kinase